MKRAQARVSVRVARRDALRRAAGPALAFRMALRAADFC